MPSDQDSRRPVAGSRQRQVQRRRAAALGLLGLVVLAISFAVEAGGGGHARNGARSPLPGAAIAQATARFTHQRSPAEDRAIDRVLAYTPFLTSGGSRRREIALTFDDGPGPFTPQVLATLRKFNVKATFFEVGFMERWFHASTTKALQEGHVIGDHTESHAKLGLLKRPAQRQQIVSQADWLHKLGAPRPRLFRPPFGSFDDRTFTVLHNNDRMLMVLWSVDAQDFRRPGVKAIVRRVMKGAKPGAIVLLHDAGGPRSQTVAALPEIIRRMRKRHFKLVTVPQLLMDDPPPHGQPLPHYLNGG
jgi:peptidoglycan/xylan/chitin deacetylase (PgdA/CDA1 family)